MSRFARMDGQFAAVPDHEIRIEDCAWYHQFDFLDDRPERAVFDLRGQVADFLLPDDLAGKRCLDIGTANGFFTFEMEKRGGEVVSFDLGPDGMWDQVPFEWLVKRPHHVAEYMNRQLGGYWYAHRHFKSRARLAYGNVMHVPTALGAFDLVFVGAILQHVHDPIGAIISASKLARETLILSEAIIPPAPPPPEPEPRSWLQRLLLPEPAAPEPAPPPEPVMKFQPRHDIHQYWTWWTFQPETFVNLLRTLGFERIELHSPFDQVMLGSGGNVPSFTIRATRNAHPKYSRGTPIDLSAGSVPYLIAGFGEPEADGRRMTRPDAALGFDIDDRDKPGELFVQLADAGTLPPGTVLEVSVNRSIVGSARLEEFLGGKSYPVSGEVMRDAANKRIALTVMGADYPFWLPAEAAERWPCVKSVCLK